MDNLTLISSLNRTIQVESLDSSFNISSVSNSVIFTNYENIVIKVGTNLNDVTFDKFFSGFDTNNLTSQASLTFFIIVICLFSFFYIIVKRARK